MQCLVIGGLVVALALPATARPQSASLAGVVRSAADGAPVARVLVLIDTGQRLTSDASGRFRFPDVAPGQHEIALVAAGCQITFHSVALAPGETRTQAFDIAYDEAVVAELVRRRRAGGTVVTAAEIEQLNPQTLTELLSRVAPGMVGSPPAQPGQDASLRGRGYVTLQGPKRPAVIVDGVVLGDAGYEGLDGILPSDVAWLEIDRGASGGWQLGTGGAGGVIRIHTRRGSGGTAPVLDPELCHFLGFTR